MIRPSFFLRFVFHDEWSGTHKELSILVSQSNEISFCGSQIHSPCHSLSFFSVETPPFCVGFGSVIQLSWFSKTGFACPCSSLPVRSYSRRLAGFLELLKGSVFFVLFLSFSSLSFRHSVWSSSSSQKGFLQWPQPPSALSEIQ
jgi:hypothetical protein